uniref:Protein kinase domain-containing protein n=1 Tax=Salmo trutta TaxID=8032 RepID=A0A674BFL6_SALTR
MAQLRIQTTSNTERLLGLVEHCNLFHVKTLCYNDVQSVLSWLGIKPGDFTFRQDEDRVTVLNNVITEHSRTTVEVMRISEEPRIEGKDHVVVYIKRYSDPAIMSCKYDSIVLFRVIRCHVRAPYSPELTKLIKDTRILVGSRRTSIFPKFASVTPQVIQAMPHQERPVIDGCPTMSYNTQPRTLKVTIDNFVIYANIAGPRGSKCNFVSRPDMVLGRGGFGVTVSVNDHLVAKTNLFPEMVDWSVPFIDNEFSRYAHIASQVEEVMIGVSIQHANILRTFGGFWCDIPGYQLGGRAVIIMERALFSMWRIDDTSIVPMVELDTLRGLEYLRSRTIQHRDFTHRNVLVCHQPDRKAIPFAFKISDFGMSCNFSTPDQPRGNCTNMAPEVLWCLNSATGSDIFSWYCVMWELHSNLPLFNYKGSEQSYCKTTYADNLSKMVGVYRSDYDDSLDILCNWTIADSPNSVYAFLLQVFLTLKAALDMHVLPTHMTEWRYILIGKGAVMIDIVP